LTTCYCFNRADKYLCGPTVKKFFTERTAIFCLLFILSSIIVFHLLVLAGVIPFQIVWGGRLTDHEQMVRFETVSILLNLFMLTVVAVRAGVLKVRVKLSVIQIMLWGMCGLLLLNTVGNLFSTNAFEKAVFTPLTLVLALCCWRLTIDKKWKSIREKLR